VPYAAEQESAFTDALKSITSIGAQVTSTILTTGSPFMGPVGGPIAALAGTILGYAGSLCESNMGAESTFSQPNVEGFQERAVIAEAVLQTVLDMPMGKYQALNIDTLMKTAYESIAPGVYKLGPRVLPILMEPAIRIALNGAPVGTESALRQDIPYTATEDSLSDENATDLRTRLLQPAFPVTSEEDFFENYLGNVIIKGIGLQKAVNSTAPTGLCFLSSILSAADLSDTKSDTNNELSVLCRRALMGEAALQAFLQADHGKLQTEGFLDSVVTAAQTIGRQVISSVPWVISQATPILAELLKGQKVNTAPTPTSIQAEANVRKTSRAATHGAKIQLDAQFSKQVGLKNKGERGAGSAENMTVREALSKDENLDGLVFATI